MCVDMKEYFTVDRCEKSLNVVKHESFQGGVEYFLLAQYVCKIMLINTLFGFYHHIINWNVLNKCSKAWKRTEIKLVVEKTSPEQLDKHDFNMTTNTTLAIGSKHLTHCGTTIRSGSLHSDRSVIGAYHCCAHETNNSIQPLMLCEKSGLCLKPLTHSKQESINYFSVGPRI